MDPQIMAVVVATIVALIISGRKLLLKLIDIQIYKLEGKDAQGRPIKRRTYDAFLKRHEFYRNMEMIRDLKSIQRVLLFVGANCGGVPTPNKAYTVKARDGWAEAPHPNPLNFYDFNLMVDSHYCVILANMIKDGYVVNNIGEMPNCILQNYYKKEGVKQSILFFLHIDPENNEMMYLSVASYTGPIEQVELDILRMHVDRMRSALEPTGLHRVLSD